MLLYRGELLGKVLDSVAEEATHARKGIEKVRFVELPHLHKVSQGWHSRATNVDIVRPRD